jgi:hypothetical protein
MVPDTEMHPTTSAAPVPPTARRRRVNILGIIFRSAFILAFGFGALWSSLPVTGSFATMMSWPVSEQIRAALGAVVCLGAILQTFNLPKDEQAYTTWTYIGTACTVTLLCVVLIKSFI